MGKNRPSEAQKIASYRYMHANNRLRTRYGIEVDFDEYMAMCHEFQTGSKNIRGLRVNHVGDKEGWIQVRGTWVCAHYKVGQRLIATFMPMPPPLDNEPAPPAVMGAANEKLAAENSRLRKKLDEMNREQNRLVDERAKKQLEDLTRARETVQGNSKRDLTWLMGQIARIETLLVQGDTDQAKDRVQVLVRMGRSAALGRFADGQDEYEDQVKQAIEARAYWTEKFDGERADNQTPEDPCPRTTPAA